MNYFFWGMLSGVGLLWFLYLFFVLISLVAWVRLPTHRLGSFSPKTKITVIIVMLNEVATICHLLDDLIQQAYPKHLFEVIVVDDDSSDGSAALVTAYQAQVPFRLHLLTNPFMAAVPSPKKRAITTAIAQASGALIVCTDADCRVSPYWLAIFAQCYETQDAKFMSGAVTFTTERRAFDYLQTVEFASLIGTGAACIYWGFPTMCNGANLAYPKAVFLEVKGYEGVAHLPSGDDEFLMHKVARRYPKGIHFIKQPAHTVQTRPAAGLSQFFQQRIRWASKWEHYTDIRIKLIALLIYLVNFTLVATAIGWLINFLPGNFFLSLLATRFIIEFFFLKKILVYLSKAHTQWWIVPTFFLYSFYVVFFGLIARFFSYSWKGRRFL